MLSPLLIPLFFRLHAQFFLSFSHSRKQYSVRYFSHNVILLSFFLYAYDLAYLNISIATFQCSKSNLSSTSVSSFFLLPSHTTFVSIVYLRLVLSVSSLYSFITCNLFYFILFVATARIRSPSPLKLRLKYASLALNVWLHYRIFTKFEW